RRRRLHKGDQQPTSPNAGRRNPVQRPANLAVRDQFLFGCSSMLADVRAEFLGGVAPLTMKLAPGSAWNTASSDGLLTQSCAQAARARHSAGMAPSSVRSSNRAPSSALVSVALMAL